MSGPNQGGRTLASPAGAPGIASSATVPGAEMPAPHEPSLPPTSMAEPPRSIPDVEVRYEDPRVGSTLADRYVITKVIGQGGMGRVYAGKHKIIGRVVAIKILHAHLVDKPDVVRRFVNEARAAGMIGHPNIVESIDFGSTDDGCPFLVLDYLEGVSLHEALRRDGPFSIERAVGVAIQVASALGAAHAQQIIHRDLKAENVFLVERDGRADHVKVLDFGISKFAPGAGEGQATAQGALLGTPQCMAPEQLYSPDAIDARVDVYALGVLVYEMLSGATPFHDVTFPHLLTAILNETPPPITDRRVDLPPELATIVHRAMAKKRDERFESMEAFYDALLPFAGATPPPRFKSRGSITVRTAPTATSTTTKARPSAPQPVVPVTPTTLGASASIREASAPALVPTARRGSRAWIAGVLAIAVGVPIAWYVWRTASHPAPTTSATAAATKTASASTEASASSAPATQNVQLSIAASRAEARLTLRNRTYALPFDESVPAGAAEEPIVVTAAGAEGRRYWVRIDHALTLRVVLGDGFDVVDATPSELARALDPSTSLASSPAPPTSASSSKPSILGVAPTHAPSSKPSASASGSSDISLHR